MVLAIVLLLIAALSFGIAWATWSESPRARCAGPGVLDREIQECVAEQARETEPHAGTLAALVVGAIALATSFVTGINSIRRVLTLAEAAQELGMSVGEVRALVDQGVIEPHHREQDAIYLNPEAIRRFALQRPTQEQALSG